jgi:hypothetical protein
MSGNAVRGVAERGSPQVIFVLNCNNGIGTSQNPHLRLLCVTEHPSLQNDQCMLRSLGGEETATEGEKLQMA